MPDWREESFVLPPGFREQSCDDGDGQSGSRKQSICQSTDAEDWSSVQEAREARVEPEVGITFTISLPATSQAPFLRSYSNQPGGGDTHL